MKPLLKTTIVTATTLIALTSLAGCSLGGSKTSSKKDTTSQNSKTNDETQAKLSAQSALDFMYQGDTSNMSEFTTNTQDDIKQLVVKKLEDKQIQAFTANGNADDYFLLLDGSKYTSTEIVKDYANAYYNQIKTVGDAKIKDVKINGDKATVTASITPIAALSEAHPIGEARTYAFGGLDNDTLVRTSQNKDIKTINKLITLKLYSVYYGDMGKVAEKSEKPVEVKFSMTKSGDHYDVNTENLMTLAKSARANVYGASQSTDDSSTSYDDTDESQV